MIDFMGKRKIFFILSILVILAGIISAIIQGLEWDIQFQGGSIIRIEMTESDYDLAEVESLVSTEIGKKVTAQKEQTFNPKDAKDNIDMLSLKVSSEDTLTDEERNKVIDIVKTNYSVKEDAQIEMRSVTPFIGDEMKKNAAMAAVIASLLIILYVWWRFSVMSGLTAAIMAVVALLHDAAIMFSMYAIFRLPLNESFVAAILFILGYSMNDTIVIYDRIRENTGALRKSQLDEMVNRSIAQTLTRTINTTVTTLICVLTVFIFAAINNIQSLKEFTMPLIVGLISGSYSSIFIASPLWAMWKQHQAKKRASLKTKPSKV